MELRPRLTHVMQGDPNSCGPACLAILATVSEEEAIRAIFGEVPPEDLCTEWPDLRRGLRNLDFEITARRRAVDDWSEIEERAIVGVGQDAHGNITHWVVYDPDERGGWVYDPLEQHPHRPRHDRRKRRPVEYLPVPID